MKKVRYTAIVIMLFTITLLAGSCQREEPETVRPPFETETENTAPGITEDKVLEPYQMTASQQPAYEFIMQEYDMGSFVYKTDYGKEMPYKLRGIIGVPDGEGTFPLVLIVHGSHANTDETARFDTGFSYLVEALAKNGYIAAALDVNAAYQWKYGDSDDAEKTAYLTGEHLKILQAASQGEGTDFPVNLAGKIDFSKTALIGHSRGAYTIFNIPEQYKDICNVNAIISIAPAAGHEADTRSWPDCNTAILVPEYDGDVVGLDGVAIYDIQKSDSQKISLLTNLKRANHNYFNNNLTNNDASMLFDEEQLTEQVTKEEQQEFLKNYVTDFLNAVNSGEEEVFYETFARIPNTMYGFDVTNKYHLPGERTLFDASGNETVLLEDCDLEKVKDSWFFEEDEIVPDTVTIGQNDYKVKELLELESEGNGWLILEEGIGDVSTYRYLCIDLLSDPQAVSEQSFCVTMTDSKGNAAKVILPKELNALQRTPGELSVTEIYDETYESWSRITPISGICIPLENFGGIDLKNIRSMEFNFDQTKQTHLYIESVTIK